MKLLFTCKSFGYGSRRLISPSLNINARRYGWGAIHRAHDKSLQLSRSMPISEHFRQYQIDGGEYCAAFHRYNAETLRIIPSLENCEASRRDARPIINERTIDIDYIRPAIGRQISSHIITVNGERSMQANWFRHRELSILMLLVK